MWQALSETQILETMGQRIKTLRLERNLSQEALAKHAGISLPTLQRLEAGKGQPKTESLIRVLRSLRRLDQLEAVFEPPPLSPVALDRFSTPPKQRARSKKPHAPVTKKGAST
jgi:transcriptional regulator with XRE-family HTH domain